MNEKKEKSERGCGVRSDRNYTRITKLSENGSRSLRNTDTDLRIPRFETSYGQRSFSYRGVKAWNKLNTEIKNALFTGYFQKFAEAIFEKTRV